MSTRIRTVVFASLAVCCVVGISLLLILNDAIRGVILDPIISGVLAFRYMLGYFPQDLEWLVSLLILSVVVAVMVTTRLPNRQRPKYIPFSPPFPKEGPAMRLTRILEKSTSNKFRRERVILEMRDLAAHTLAYNEGVSVEEASESLDTDSWTNSATVRDFLSLDKHRAGKNDQKEFHAQVDHALAHIEQMYQEV